MQWMWDLRRVMLAGDRERRGILPACLRLRVYFTDVIRASYVFRRTVSLFSFCVIISQLKCKVTKAVVTSLVFIIKYSD